MGAILQISEETPSYLLRDFRVYLEYLNEKRITLTHKNRHLRGKDLFELNQLMTEPQEEVTKRTFQTTYPQLHLFYHLVRDGKLFRIDTRGSRPLFQPTENLGCYQQNLNPVERYFFLLETLWVDCKWDKLNQDYRAMYTQDYISFLFNMLKDQEPGATFDSYNSPEVLKALNFLGYFIIYFELFGFYKIELDRERMASISSNRAYQAKTITLTPFGAELIPVLIEERPVQKFNLPSLREEGVDIGLPGQRPMLKENFIDPFIPLFPDSRLQGTIPRKEPSFNEGSYTFKVSLDGNTWRTLRMSAHHTLHDLHLLILSAYGFTGGDHLYAFFMEGKAWEGLSYSSPQNSGLNADKKKIGELGLEVDRDFLYLYDFGDEWKFRVNLIDWVEDKEKSEPTIIESRGSNPEQYPYHF